MRVQVAGLFQREEGAVEAVEMLHAAGYASSDLDLVSKEPPRNVDLPSLTRHVHLGRLMQTPEGTWPCALRGALIGSLAIEVPVLICVLLAFDSWAIQVFLASTLWKIGALFGGLLGAVVGSHRGLEGAVAHRYEKYLDLGAIALAARVEHLDAPQARGIFIESGAFDIRNVEGQFIAKDMAASAQTVSDGRDNHPGH